MSKEAKICYLKDEQGDFISPITNENSIFNDEGNNSFENINQRLCLRSKDIRLYF